MNSNLTQVSWLQSRGLKQACIACGLLVVGALAGWGLTTFTATRPRPTASKDKTDRFAFLHQTAELKDQEARVEFERQFAEQILDTPEFKTLEEENNRLAVWNQMLQAQLTDITNWILDNFEGKYPLADKHITKLAIPSVTKNFTLHPDIAEMLHISEAETAKLNDVFSSAHVSITELQAERMTYSNPDEEKAVLQIPAFPVEGDAVREGLLSAMATALGEHRYNRFIDLSDQHLESSFDEFGKSSRTIIFELVYENEDDPPQLLINDSRMVPDADNKKWSIHATEAMVDELPDEYLDFGGYLPEGVQQFLLGK